MSNSDKCATDKIDARESVFCSTRILVRSAKSSQNTINHFGKLQVNIIQINWYFPPQSESTTTELFCEYWQYLKSLNCSRSHAVTRWVLWLHNFQIFFSRYIAFSLERYNRMWLTLLVYSGVACLVGFVLFTIKFLERDEFPFDTFDRVVKALRLFPLQGSKLWGRSVILCFVLLDCHL